MKDFKEVILGNMNTGLFGASMFFAILTAIALILFRVKKRDVNSDRTPEHFSWNFFWSDNFKQQIGTLILIFLCIRVSQYYVKPEWLVYSAILIGLISDQLAMLALKLKDKATQFLSKKIDKVEDKVDAVKEVVDEIKNQNETK